MTQTQQVEPSKSRVVSTRIDSETDARLRAVCEYDDRNEAHILRVALARYLAQRKVRA